MKTVLAFSLIAMSATASAEWKCVNSSGDEYTASQRVLSDTCTNIESGEVRTPSAPIKPKPFKSDPKEARRITTSGKAALIAVLKDPDSAKFRGLFTYQDMTLCGEVNAKNSYGGYTGFKRFISSPIGGTVWIDDDEDSFVYKWAIYCHGMTAQEIKDAIGR